MSEASDAAATPPGDARALDALGGALARVGDRWSLLVVAALLDGPRRFGQLGEVLPGIAPNVLSQRLKHLEREQIVHARAYSRRPPRFVYDLTGSGRDLAGALRLLADWGARTGEAGDLGRPRHRTCGTALEVRWFCPTCVVTVEDPEADDLHYA